MLYCVYDIPNSAKSCLIAVVRADVSPNIATSILSSNVAMKERTLPDGLPFANSAEKLMLY